MGEFGVCELFLSKGREGGEVESGWRREKLSLVCKEEARKWHVGGMDTAISGQALST